MIVAVAALRLPRRSEPAAATRAVAALGIAFVASQLLQLAVTRIGFEAALRNPLGWAALVGLVAAALAIVAGTAVLGFHGAHRRRDYVWSAVLAAIALALLRARAPALLPALFACFAAGRLRWRKQVGGGTLVLVILIGIGAVVWNTLTPALPITLLPGPWPEVATWAEWTRALVGTVFFFALPGSLILAGVSIRSVPRRLALSHLLTGLVPIVLIAALWFVSTYLGSGAERALTAARLLESEGARIEAALGSAARESGRLEAELDDLGADLGSHWRGTRIWIAGEEVRRVHGDPLPGEERLAAWPESLASHGIVSIEDSIYLGARVALGDSAPERETAPARALIALVPLPELFEGGIEHAVGASLSMDTRTVFSAGGGSIRVSTDREDSALAVGASNRSFPEQRRIADSLMAASAADTLREKVGLGTILAGHATLEGLRVTPTRWIGRGYLLRADVRLTEIFTGLARNTRENPYNYLVLVILGMLATVFLVVAIFNVGMVANLSRSITRAIAALRRGTDQLQSGNLAHRIEVEGRDDLWSVAGAFNQMAAGLERSRELEKERERLESELAVARQIQARLLPAGAPRIAGLEIAGTSESARQVGGDYYDHIPLGDGRVLLVIADVSGKGVPAALIMSGFRAALMSQDVEHQDVARVAERMNHFLHRSVETGRFVTAFLGVLEGDSGRLAYTNAGHNPPLVVHRGGEIERLSTGGLMFGVVPEFSFEHGEARLARGELAVLYTDGVTEAANAGGELWEEERLIACLREVEDAPCETVVSRIVAEVRRFEGDQGPSDDITLLVARRRA